MTCEEFNDISGALVLRATTPEEQVAAFLHLQHCAQCRQIWQELRTTVDLLPLAAPQVSPSSAARAHLLEQVLYEVRIAAQPRRNLYLVSPTTLFECKEAQAE